MACFLSLMLPSTTDQLIVKLFTTSSNAKFADQLIVKLFTSSSNAKFTDQLIVKLFTTSSNAKFTDQLIVKLFTSSSNGKQLAKLEKPSYLGRILHDMTVCFILRIQMIIKK